MTPQPEPSLTEIVTDEEPLSGEEFDDLVATWAEAAGAGEPIPVTPQPFPLWVPRDEAEANWAASKLRALNDELGAVTEHRNMMLDQIKAWYEDRVRQPRRRALFLDAALQTFALRWQAEDEKRRTLHLPEGSALRVRVPQTRKVVAEDEAAVLQWIRDRAKRSSKGVGGWGAAIKVTPDELMISEVRKMAVAAEVGDTWRAVDKQTGEVIPGLAVEDLDPPTAKIAL